MRGLIYGLVLLLLHTSAALAEERILSFDSYVTINADASLSVTETILVLSEGENIKRGILRDFPTQYKDKRGFNVNVGFEVLGVRRDGRDEPFTVESIAHGKRIRIGDADVYLDPGKYRYEIIYRTTRQLGFFDSFDELYWNVTGDGWTFPIDKSAVRIVLPAGATIESHAAYTGVSGTQGDDFKMTQSQGNIFSAQTTRRLEANEGFTIAVSWPKGFVIIPTEAQGFGWFIRDNAGMLILIMGSFLISAYYLYAWHRVGRDPPQGQVIPLFSPPNGLGPAATRYVWRQNYDDRTFAAALIGLAAQGWLKIRDSDDEYSIEALKHSGKVPSKEERALYQALGSGMIAVKQSNHEQLSRIQNALKSALLHAYEGVMFNRNRIWFWTGAALSFVMLLLSALFLPEEEAMTGLFVSFWSIVWWGTTFGILRARLRTFLAARGILKKIGVFITLLFMLPFVAACFFPFFFMGASEISPGLYALFGTAIFLAVINLTFLNLLLAPTIPGRKLMDEIEGFRMYLSTAEEERLNILHPPEKTPELFERYLPYALALDCENEWNSKFESVLKAAEAQGRTSPGWYSGRGWDSGNVGRFASSFGSSLAASSMAPPSRSSGSSGGGFSGGGGGGGGGSGW